MTEAQKKARNKYNKANLIRVYLFLNKKTEKDIINHLNKQSNKNGYLKRLIMNDINNSQ